MTRTGLRYASTRRSPLRLYSRYHMCSRGNQVNPYPELAATLRRRNTYCHHGEPYVHHPDLTLATPARRINMPPHPSSDHNTDICAFALSSSRFATRSFACSCLIAAFTFLCRFRRPFPRLGPSTTTGSAMRCFRFANCSARCFSRFLSRLRSVAKHAFRRLP